MNRINSIVNNITFRRILVIFLVGLVSRNIVNNIYDINVFKDYNTLVSLIYYGFMAGFTGFIYELPQISLNVFNLNLIRNAIKMVCENNFMVGNKVLSVDSMFTDNLNKDLHKNNLVLKESDEITAGRQRRFKSAGVRGLYGDPNNRDIVYEDQRTNLSFRNRVKCRFLWPFIKHYTDFVSYKDYSGSFDSNGKVSIRSEIKKVISKRQ